MVLLSVGSLCTYNILLSTREFPYMTFSLTPSPHSYLNHRSPSSRQICSMAPHRMSFGPFSSRFSHVFLNSIPFSLSAVSLILLARGTRQLKCTSNFVVKTVSASIRQCKFFFMYVEIVFLNYLYSSWYYISAHPLFSVIYLYP